MGSANAGPSYIIDDILKAAVAEGIELERHQVGAVFGSSDIPAVWKEFHPEPLSGLEFAPWLFQLSPSYAHISSHDAALMSDRLLRPLEGEYWWNAVRLCVWSTTESIFIIRQQQEKYIAANEPLYFAFVDIKKPLIECLGKYCGGFWGASVSMNGLSMSFRARTPMP